MVSGDRITEKTLEINICNNLIEAIKRNRLYNRAYWIGVSMRLERRIGLDVKLAPGTSQVRLVLGLQFKKPKKKGYDYNSNEYYYLFEINNNSANDQHIILWLLSELIHRIAGNRYVFIGYVFPKYIDHSELHRYSPNFLGKTIFIDAGAFPIGILNRLPHEVVIYERSRRAIVRSKEYELETKDILSGEELLKRLTSFEHKYLPELKALKYRSRSILEEVLSELHIKAKENEVKEDTVRYIMMKIDDGWQIKISSLLL